MSAPGFARERVAAPRAGLFVVAAALSGFVGCMHAGGMRDSWQKPREVINGLEIQPGDRIADLGAGEGYFTFRLAEATGPGGVVYAVDIDEEALARLAATAAERGVSHVQTVVAAADAPGLAPASVDLIFVCNTYHHLEDRTAYFTNLRAALLPHGRIAIIELDDTPWYVAFMSAHETEVATIQQEMNAAGYVRSAVFDFLEYQSFQVFAVAEAVSEED